MFPFSSIKLTLYVCGDSLIDVISVSELSEGLVSLLIGKLSFGGSVSAVTLGDVSVVILGEVSVVTLGEVSVGIIGTEDMVGTVCEGVVAGGYV